MPLLQWLVAAAFFLGIGAQMASVAGESIGSDDLAVVRTSRQARLLGWMIMAIGPALLVYAGMHGWLKVS